MEAGGVSGNIYKRLAKVNLSRLGLLSGFVRSIAELVDSSAFIPNYLLSRGYRNCLLELPSNRLALLAGFDCWSHIASSLQM